MHQSGDLERSGPRGVARCAWIVATLLLASCGGEPEFVTTSELPIGHERFDPASLPPPEVFTWGSQPISASPAPEGWYREKAQSGGLRGVRFIKSRSFGEEIRIAEHYALDNRSRCAQLTALLRDFENLDRRDFLGALQRARFYAPDPINSYEERKVAAANADLDAARTAYLAGDLNGARRAIQQALRQGSDILYRIEEVIDRVMFDPGSYDSFGEVETMPPQTGYVAEAPSVSVDYTLDSRDNGHLYYGRQVYVLENNHLFVLTFHGLQHNLPLFEAIVDSVSFPRGQCAR